MTGAPPLILIGGGARSGKSRFALARAVAAVPGGGRGLFVATAEPSDEEMRERIGRHRRERDALGGQAVAGGLAFRTVEEPVALPELLHGARRGDGDSDGDGDGGGRGDHHGDEAVVVVDCLTLWLSNLLVRGATSEDVEGRVAALIDSLAGRRVPVILVTNEVGMGLVPETPLGRSFRDVTGIAHQRLAAVADEIYFAALGTVIRLHPPPLALAAPLARAAPLPPVAP
jgi:adenosylcobinamide kinase/adenosylcobinamide-phosphate guanylyltransferase